MDTIKQRRRYTFSFVDECGTRVTYNITARSMEEARELLAADTYIQSEGVIINSSTYIREGEQI